MFHYVSLHSAPFAIAHGLSQVSSLITDDLSSRLVRLPMHFDLTDAQIRTVCDAVHDFYATRRAGFGRQATQAEEELQPLRPRPSA